VIGDVTTAVHREQLGPHAGRVDEHVLRPGADAGGEHVGVLQEQ
jgi:hypothetical protein